MKTMRNKTTGEFRDVDESEFKDLVQEVTPDGFPRWEQTSYPHRDAVEDRATYGELLEEDLGKDAKELLKHEALVLDAEGVGPEHNPHLQLSPGEIEEGLTPEDKLEQLRQQYASSVPRREEIMAKSAEKIVGQEPKSRRSSVPTKGLKARAGGSDDRVNVPKADASDKSQAEAAAAPESDSGEE
jgi:hypothetical protein